MARKIRHRPDYPTVAVVGEGEVERVYFHQLKQVEHIRFTVKPNLPKNSSIKAIVDKGLELLDAEFDTVFCVFDMDKIFRDKTIYQQYQKLKKAHQKKDRLIFIENNPCIEHWFLLHFEQTERHFDNDTQLLNQLRNHITDYEKTVKYLTRKGIYKLLKPHQQLARERAKQLKKKGHDISSSDMYKILDHLVII